MKEKVILEPLPKQSDRVAVLYYDVVGKTLTDEVLEVIDREEVQDKYLVVGEFRNGELHMYDEDEHTYDYDEEDIIEEMGLTEEWHED